MNKHLLKSLFEETPHHDQSDLDYRFAKKIVDTTNEWKSPSEGTTQEAWEAIAGKLDETTNNTPSKIIKLYSPYWIWAAACAIIGLSLGLYFNNQDTLTTELTQKGTRKSIQLPDGSVVLMMPETSLTYDTKNWDESRSLSLTGEAFFDVMEGVPFTVEAGPVKVEVLGTTFNVQNRPQTSKVSCIQGLVKVVSDFNKEGEMLQANEGVMLNIPEKTFAKTVINSNQIKERKKGVFHFKNANINTVFNEFERQFDKEIILTVSDRKVSFSGHFTNNNLETALNLICLPTQLSYTIDNDTIWIK